MTERSLVDRVKTEARALGLSISGLQCTPEADAFGDCQVTGRLGPMAVRFVRERGQDWLEIGPMDAEPPAFYSFQDAQVALGWKTISQVLEMRDVEPLGDVLKLLATRWSEITQLLSGQASSFGWKRVEKAADERGRAFADRFR